MNRSSLWWQKVQERLSMDSFSMFAMLAEKRQIIKTWKTTSRQTIWKEYQSPATSVKRCSGQGTQKPITYHFSTGTNQFWHNLRWCHFHFICLEQGMVWGRNKPWITLGLLWATMNNAPINNNTWTNKLWASCLVSSDLRAIMCLSLPLNKYKYFYVYKYKYISRSEIAKSKSRLVSSAVLRAIMCLSLPQGPTREYNSKQLLKYSTMNLCNSICSDLDHLVRVKVIVQKHVLGILRDRQTMNEQGPLKHM